MAITLHTFLFLLTSPFRARIKLWLAYGTGVAHGSFTKKERRVLFIISW